MGLTKAEKAMRRRERLYDWGSGVGVGLEQENQLIYHYFDGKNYLTIEGLQDLVSSEELPQSYEAVKAFWMDRGASLYEVQGGIDHGKEMMLYSDLEASMQSPRRPETESVRLNGGSIGLLKVDRAPIEEEE